MKKVLIGMFALVACAGMAMAAGQNYCAYAKCFACGATYEDTIGEKTREAAIETAKGFVEHKQNCTAKSGRRTKAKAAYGSCPLPPSNENDGE